jgi:DNA-binding beta-propeller fold protein YncE
MAVQGRDSINARPKMRIAIALIAALAVGAVTVAVVPSDDDSASAAKPGAKKKKPKKPKKPKKKPKKPGAAKAPRHSEFIFVGNNWEGTADVLRFAPPHTETTCVKTKRGRGCAKYSAKRERKIRRKKGRPGKLVRTDQPLELQRMGRMNIIPDYNQRVTELLLNPVRLAYFLAVRLLIGEGHDQFVDDMYSSKDGEVLFVSRPSFADVVAIKISTGEIIWRFVVAGQRADHMAISPDGRHLAVSASTGNLVHIIDTATGLEAGRFLSGDSPHENTYSADGKRIYHASIGLVYTPADHPILDTTKGQRYFQIVDAQTNQIIRRVNMAEKLAAAGYPDMSSAVRPMAVTADERFVYLQVSFFHGFAEYDVQNDTVRRVASLPNLIPEVPRESYLLDSAHHGIALNGKDDKLCVAGTMSDYAAIVSRENLADYTLIQKGEKPYWSTTSEDGNYCYVSWSGTDAISVISYDERREIARIDVGDHPQRIRTGQVSPAALAALAGTLKSGS